MADTNGTSRDTYCVAMSIYYRLQSASDLLVFTIKLFFVVVVLILRIIVRTINK